MVYYSTLVSGLEVYSLTKPASYDGLDMERIGDSKEKSEYHKTQESNEDPAKSREVNRLEQGSQYTKNESDSKEEEAQEDHYASPVVMVKDRVDEEVKQGTK